MAAAITSAVLDFSDGEQALFMLAKLSAAADRANCGGRISSNQRQLTPTPEMTNVQPMLGPTELAIIFFFILVLAGFAVAVVAAARRANQPRVPRRQFTAPDLENAVHDLIAQGKSIHAIKLVREQTGLGLKQAKDLVDGVAEGRPLNTHPAVANLRPAPTPHSVTGPDLATRVRELKAAGRTEQAIFLVRGETGMGQHEAEQFVEVL